MNTRAVPIVLEGDLDDQTYSLFKAWGREEGLAVDIETTGLSPMLDRVEVISLAAANGFTAVVPLVPYRAAGRVGQLLEDPRIFKVFHHALFDVGFLRYRWDLQIGPIFCTKVAARIAGIDRNSRLETLISVVLGQRITKD